MHHAKMPAGHLVFKDFDIIASAVVSTFWINYLIIFLNKMRGNPQFSCWISIVLAKISFPRIVINHTKRYVLHDQNSQLAKQEHNNVMPEINPIRSGKVSPYSDLVILFILFIKVINFT